MISILPSVSACHLLSPSHASFRAACMGTQRPGRPPHLNVPIVREGERDGLESDVLVADAGGQMVDGFLHLLHSLGDALVPQFHLGGGREQHRGHLQPGRQTLV